MELQTRFSSWSVMLTKEAVVILCVCTDFGCSILETKQYLNKKGYKISLRTVSNYRRRYKDDPCRVFEKKQNPAAGRQVTLSKEQQRDIEKLLSPDPPTYRTLATQYQVSKQAIFRIKN